MREGRHFKTSLSKRKTLGDLIERYIVEVLPTKPKSMNAQGRQLRWWKNEIGHCALSEVSPSVLAKTRDKLHQGRQPATVVRYMAALSHAFSVAESEWEWLETNPLKRVRKPKEPRGRVRYLDKEERVRLLESCSDSSCEHLYPIVILALSTGMRQSEILSLEWKNVDLIRGYIILEETKNGERRSVPLVGRARNLFQELSKVRRLDTNLVFYSTRNPQVPVFIRTPWGHAVKEACVHDFRFHDLRHSAASYLAMNGASLVEIADILGHKTLLMVKRYAHLSEQHTSKVLESMNSEIFP
jgi:integrase